MDEQNYHQKHQLGDTVQVDYEKLIRFMLEDNGLTEIAALFSILIGFSLDGGSLTSMTSHIFAGAKSLDLRSMKNGKLIFKDVDENGDEIFCNVQSNTNIYLMKLAYVKDGKEPYELYFRDWFQFVQKLKKYGLPARPDRGWKIVQPVQVCLPQDTSSIQKAIGMGGACKACDLFCHACACTSYGPKSMLLFFREGRWRCRRFCLNKHTFSKQCYHWEVDDDEEISRKKQQIKVIFLYNELYAVCSAINHQDGTFLVPSVVRPYCQANKVTTDYHVEEEESVINGTKIEWMPTDANKHNNINHIDFIIPPLVPGQPVSRIRIQYGGLLKRELILRKMFRELGQGKTLESMQKILKRSLMEGVEVKMMRVAINRWSRVGENCKQMTLEEAIFCTLHLELRVNEAKIGGVLNEGFTHRKTCQLVDEYVGNTENIVNKGKLGMSTHQNQWRFPISKDRKSIDSGFSLKNGLSREMFLRIDDIIEEALRYHSNSYKNEWKEVIVEYLNIVEILLIRKQFSDKMIYEFQDKVDGYYKKWIKLTGRNGMTNYIHFLGSGHVAYYFFKYRNLYRFSQQGFEAMMGKIKAIYHRCTSRGGNGSAEEDRSHILQVAHFLMRMMMWNSGRGDAYFRKKYGDEIVDDAVAEYGILH